MQHILPERTCPITERRDPIDGLLLRLVEAGHDGLHSRAHRDRGLPCWCRASSVVCDSMTRDTTPLCSACMHTTRVSFLILGVLGRKKGASTPASHVWATTLACVAFVRADPRLTPTPPFKWRRGLGGQRPPPRRWRKTLGGPDPLPQEVLCLQMYTPPAERSPSSPDERCQIAS